MAAPVEIDAWLRQARADLEAARAGTVQVSEGHRRYWFQQSCEKALKALGLLLWTGQPGDPDFCRFFLYKHSPLRNLNQQQNLPTPLKGLLRAIQGQIIKLDGRNLIEKVDATTPTLDTLDVSYRYPFRDTSGRLVAPCEWTTADWDAYQGNAQGVDAALDRLLGAVTKAAKVQKRKP